MPCLRRACLAVVLGSLPALSPAQTPQVGWNGDSMRLRSASVVPSGGVFRVTLTMEDDNQNSALGSTFRRWWHCEIGNLNPAGTTLDVSVVNAGYSDVILPVWALSTDGISFGGYARCPLSAVPVVVGGSTHRFTLTTPPGVVAIRLAKYFPYPVARKDAFVQSLQGQPKVRSIRGLGSSRQGRPIQQLELTDPNVGDVGKARVWIHAGIHPSETTSYFTVEGLVAWLLSADPYAALLLHDAIIDIVPMANPDGVYLGNYRTNANSANLEDEWAAPYQSAEPEVAALRTAIEGCMGTPAQPGANPLRVLLNLHSSHNISYPFLYLHTANPNWNAATSNSGVIPAVNAVEAQWIAQFRARSAFVGRGTTQSSTAGAPTRPFVESMMHDRWSALPQWTAAPNFLPVVMAITFEGTYGLGPDGVNWNTEADYRLCGAQLGRALVDHLGLQFSASLAPFGSSCGTVVLAGSLAPAATGHLATLTVAGAPANALGWLLLGTQQTSLPLPAPWTCSLLVSPDASAPLPIGPFGLAQVLLPVPPLPGLHAWLQVLTADPSVLPLPAVQSSNGLDLRNNF